MSNQTHLAALVERRNEALSKGDMAYVKEVVGPGYDDLVYEIALHKARYESLGVDTALRLDSAAWLRERGYQAMSGPLLPEGELPK